MRVLFDTNILARSTQTSHALMPIARAAGDALQARGDELCIVPQVLYEFWVVCTRPIVQNGLGFDVPRASLELANARNLFVVLDDVPAILPEWERLVVAHDVKGKSAHDARLVAAMNVHGVPAILTFNVSDFTRYPSLTVLDPHGVASGTP
jgi:predicted nucleic acid-binding protein